jgi:opacity protein-like surface antigen
VTQEEKKPEPTVMAEQENIEEHEEAARGAKSGNNESSAQEQENHKEASTEEATIEKTKKTEEEPLPKVLTKVSVKVPRANIRLMPTTQSTIIQQVRSGTELKHLAKTGNWHRVNLDPNEEGFVLSGYIHQSIVNEVYETLAPPPDPEKKPETEPEVIEEKTEPEPEPEPVQEIPTLRKKSLGKYYWVGGGAGYTMPSESNFEKGVNFGGTFGLGITKHLAFELRVPYFQSDVMGTADGLSSGRLSSLSLMLSIQGRYPIKNRFIPYLVVGGDYHLNTFSINEEIAQAWNQLGFNIEESVDHTFGLHLGAGLDVFLMHNIALTVDVLYYTTNLTGKRTLANQISQEMTSGAINNMKFNSLQAALSVKLFFNPLGRKQ